MTAAPATTAKPFVKPNRLSPDSFWPLRCADGRTFAERKEERKCDG